MQQRSVLHCCGSLEVLLWHPPHCNGPRLHKVLQRHVVNALGAQDDVGACVEDELDALLGDVILQGSVTWHAQA